MKRHNQSIWRGLRQIMVFGSLLIGVSNLVTVLWASQHGGEHVITGVYPAGITMAFPTAVAIILLSGQFLIGIFTDEAKTKTEYRKDNE